MAQLITEANWQRVTGTGRLLQFTTSSYWRTEGQVNRTAAGQELPFAGEHAEAAYGAGKALRKL